MKRILRKLWRRWHRPEAPKKTAREKFLERQWADLLRYEGRPLHEDQD